jgi:hypothetical protein
MAKASGTVSLKLAIVGQDKISAVLETAKRNTAGYANSAKQNLEKTSGAFASIKGSIEGMGTKWSELRSKVALATQAIGMIRQGLDELQEFESSRAVDQMFTQMVEQPGIVLAAMRQASRGVKATDTDLKRMAMSARAAGFNVKEMTLILDAASKRSVFRNTGLLESFNELNTAFKNQSKESLASLGIEFDRQKYIEKQRANYKKLGKEVSDYTLNIGAMREALRLSEEVSGISRIKLSETASVLRETSEELENLKDTAGKGIVSFLTGEGFGEDEADVIANALQKVAEGGDDMGYSVSVLNTHFGNMAKSSPEIAAFLDSVNNRMTEAKDRVDGVGGVIRDLHSVDLPDWLGGGVEDVGEVGASAVGLVIDAATGFTQQTKLGNFQLKEQVEFLDQGLGILTDWVAKEQDITDERRDQAGLSNQMKLTKSWLQFRENEATSIQDVTKRIREARAALREYEEGWAATSFRAGVAQFSGAERKDFAEKLQAMKDLVGEADFANIMWRDASNLTYTFLTDQASEIEQAHYIMSGWEVYHDSAKQIEAYQDQLRNLYMRQNNQGKILEKQNMITRSKNRMTYVEDKAELVKMEHQIRVAEGMIKIMSGEIDLTIAEVINWSKNIMDEADKAERKRKAEKWKQRKEEIKSLEIQRLQNMEKMFVLDLEAKGLMTDRKRLFFSHSIADAIDDINNKKRRGTLEDLERAGKLSEKQWLELDALRMSETIRAAEKAKAIKSANAQEKDLTLEHGREMETIDQARIEASAKYGIDQTKYAERQKHGAILAAEHNLERKLSDINQRKTDSIIDAAEADRQIQIATLTSELEIEAIYADRRAAIREEEFERRSELLDEWTVQLDNVSGPLSQIIALDENASAGTETLAAAFAVASVATSEMSAATNGYRAALPGMLSASGAAASGMIEDTKRQAQVQGMFEIASSLSSFAFGDIKGGALHAASAAAFFALAGKGGSGKKDKSGAKGGSISKGGGGGGSSKTGSTTSNLVLNVSGFVGSEHDLAVGMSKNLSVLDHDNPGTGLGSHLA